jgi:DNA-directed RNA polymerase specialized sigma24 family protein
MTNASDFDALYAATWRPLLLQTFAVCGDLGTAREALQHSFVDTWHHWPRAQRRGAESYVRSGAFARAQWRSRARAFQRAQRVTREQRAALRTLQGLPPQARRAVVLTCLSDLTLAEIGRQIGETERHTEELIQAGLAELAGDLDLRQDAIAPRLRGLEGAARAAAQPTPDDLRRLGIRRRRLWLGAGTVAAVGLTVLAGAFVRLQPVEAVKLPPPLGPAVSRAMLLGTDGLKPIGDPDRWQVRSTSDNTGGTGINTLCQGSRFADPHGLRAFVRTFALSGKQPRTATQTIELSRTVRQSHQAFRTAVGWFAGCNQARLQLLSTYDVRQLGDEAMILKFRAEGARLDSFSVGVARSGHISTWTAVVTRGASNPETSKLVDTLGNSVGRLCSSRAAGACAMSPVVQENPPPPSGEQPGMLAVADLPAVGRIDKPWVGTRAARVQGNPAATTCDNADFETAGASGVLSRTFLVPGSKTPARFGITETSGSFASAEPAKAFVTRVRAKMDKCPDKDLGAKITQHAEMPIAVRGSAWYLWRLESAVSDNRTVVFWMGITRVGNHVAQVSFVPGDGADQDIDRGTFEDLLKRTRDRLFELPSTPSPGQQSGTDSTPSGGPTPTSSPG